MSETPDDPPPILGRWRNLYVLVVGFLAVQVLVYWWLTRAFS